jgi:hypothetical protein
MGGRDFITQEDSLLSLPMQYPKFIMGFEDISAFK